MSKFRPVLISAVVGLSLLFFCFGLVQYRERKVLEQLLHQAIEREEAQLANLAAVGEHKSRGGVAPENSGSYELPKGEGPDRQASDPERDFDGDVPSASAYDAFFDELGLLPYQRASFRALQRGKYQLLLRDKRTEEDAQRLAEIELAIRGLFGDDDYADFSLFRESQPERVEIASFKFLLNMYNLSISPEAEQQLMNVMYEMRSARAENLVAVLLDPKNSSSISQNLERLRYFQQEVYERVASGLSEEQQAVFRENQAYQLSALEAGLEL